MATRDNQWLQKRQTNKISRYRRPISDGNPVEAVTRKHVLHAKSADRITERNGSNSLTREAAAVGNRYLPGTSASRSAMQPIPSTFPSNVHIVVTHRLYNIGARVPVYVNRFYQRGSGNEMAPFALYAQPQVQPQGIAIGITILAELASYF